MKRILGLIAFLIALIFPHEVMAEYYEFHEGENFLAPYKSVEGTYIVSKSGKIVIETQENGFKVVCNGQTYSPKNAYTIGGYNTRYDLEANAGSIVYITLGFAFGEKIRITETGGSSMPIQLLHCTPVENKLFTWNTAGMVTLQFNTLVKVSSVTLNYNGKDYNVDDLRQGGSQFVSFNVTNAINEAYKNGLTYGKQMTVTVNGITDLNDPDNLYGGTGKLIIIYGSPHQQGTLVKCTSGNSVFNEGVTDYTFLSYYSDEQEEGRFVFEFSNPVGSIDNVKLTMGNIDQSTNGGYYYETFDKVSIEGNKVIVDARGVLRSLTRMFPTINLAEATADPESRGYIDFSHLSLTLTNVIDTNGNFMYCKNTSNVGSYSFVLNYKEIVDDIYMDGDTEADSEGTIKNGGERICLWIDQEVKRIDGLNVYIKVDNGQTPYEDGTPAYGVGTIKVPIEDIQTVSTDPKDGTVIAFILPELRADVEEGGEVAEPEIKNYEAVVGEEFRVVLQVTTTNGLPHDLEIKYFYKTKDPAGIVEVVAPTTLSTKAYNIAGQRVSDNAKGIIILNGKKVMQ